MSETMTRDDVMDGLMDQVEKVDTSRPRMAPGTNVWKITKVQRKEMDNKLESEGAVKGWTTMNVEFTAANGPFEGKQKVWKDYFIGAPKNAEDKVVPNPAKIAKHMADEKLNLDYAGAVDKATEGVYKAVQAGIEGLAKLQNAAGFIVEAMDKDGSGAKRITAGLAQPYDKSTFQWTDLEGRDVMGKTVEDTYNGVTRLKLTSVWDVDPNKVGDLAQAAPF